MGVVFCIASLCNIAYAMDKIEIIRDIPNLQKEAIYTAVKQWAAQNFESAQDVVQFDDKEAGTLIFKGNIDYPCSTKWSCNLHKDEIVKFAMKVDIKDQKIRVVVDDVLVNGMDVFFREVNKEPSGREVGIFNKRFLGLSNSLILSVERYSETKANDNW